MEEWLAELELEMNTDSMFMEQHQQCEHQNHSNNTMETTPFHEQLAAVLGEDFPYPLTSESDTSSPQFDYTNLIEPPECYLNSSGSCDDFMALVNSDPMHSAGASDVGGGSKWLVDQVNVDDNKKDDGKKKQVEKEKTGNGGRKRKREPSQVMDHILAERKRRELLSQLFIALSAIVPDLKKTDKTSVLGEAIKYMKQLQEKVKVLEDVEARRTVESVVVVVRRSQMVVDDEAVDDNGSSCTVEDTHLGINRSGSNNSVSNLTNDSTLPEIEVKVSDKSLLIKVYCEKSKGVLQKLFAVLDKHDDMRVTSCSIIPFGSLGCDITIVVEKETGFDKNVRDLVRSLRSALLVTSQVPNELKP